MHKFVNNEDIFTTVTPESDCDVVIASSSWGERFLNHYFDNIQRNHELCLSKVEQRYEYLFVTREVDYQKYKDRFIIPDITFLFFDEVKGILLPAVHLDYCYKRDKPFISLAGDCFHTPNLLSNLLTKYNHYDVCGCVAQRSCSNILDVIKEKEKSMPYEDIFAPRELLKTHFPYLYGTEIGYFMDAYNSQYNAAFFPVISGDELIGILERSFHYGIIYVKNPLPHMERTHPSLGLDPNPFLTNLATPETTGLITDSDDGFVIDIMPHQGSANLRNRKQNLVKSNFQEYWDTYRDRGVCPVNETFMQYNVAIHSEPLNDEWLSLAKEADTFVTEVYGGAIKNKPLTWEMLP